jgi:hypothetical protein
MADELKDATVPTAESIAVDGYIAHAKAALIRFGIHPYGTARESQAFIAGYIQACAIQALTTELARTREALVESIDALPHATEIAAEHD